MTELCGVRVESARPLRGESEWRGFRHAAETGLAMSLFYGIKAPFSIQLTLSLSLSQSNDLDGRLTEFCASLQIVQSCLPNLIVQNSCYIIKL